MTGADLIRRAADAGVSIVLGNGRLRLHAKRQPEADLLAELVENKVEIIRALSATKVPMPASTWLWLLLLDDDGVIQCGITGKDRPVFDETITRAVAVPGFERPLSEEEVAKALAGTLRVPAPTPVPAQSSGWLVRVARLLGVRPAELLEGWRLEPHSLAELAGADAEQVADMIRCSPAWINRPRRAEAAIDCSSSADLRDNQPQHFILTAVTASPEWREVRDRFHSHLKICSDCYAPKNRYCAAGSDLRQRYDQTPMEPAP
ncbi:hypothetical protein D3C84_129740 [compost metagenome]